MNISGLQKLTLLDYPGKVACTVFLAGCNFRCPYCHNSELLTTEVEPVMDDTELLEFLKKRVGLLEAVCVTGGEPTLNRELKSLLQQIKGMGYLVKLDTNGTRPTLLKELVAEGLVDYVAMDVKNCPAKYASTVGVETLDIDSVRESMQYLLSDAVDYEFRTTVVAELFDEDSFLEIGELLKTLSPEQPAKRFFLQPFVDRDTVAFSNLNAPSQETLEHYVEQLRPFVKDIQIRGM